MYKPRHFSIEELVCLQVYEKFGETAWSFFDDKLLQTLDLLRDQLGPIYINNWDSGGQFDQRGFRCLHCQLVMDAIKKGTLYCSAHMTGQAADFDVKDMSAAQVRLWILQNDIKLPYPVRLEKSTNWVHIDIRDSGQNKVSLF
jgi:hypothetical protein